MRDRDGVAMPIYADPQWRMTSKVAGRDVAMIRALQEFFLRALLPGARIDGNALGFTVPFETFLAKANADKQYADLLRHVLPDQGLDELKILDLACGPSPLLATLLEDHRDRECSGKPCQHFGRVVSYLGVDRTILEDYKHHHQKFAERFDRCFPRVAFESLDLSKRSDLETLRSRGQFDMVALSNAMHELPLESWTEILLLVPDLLTDQGLFVLLDLGLDARFNSAYWEEMNFLKRPRFWEASAIWINGDDAVSLVAAAGLKVADKRLNEGQLGDWWYVKGRKTAGALRPLEDRRADLRTTIASIVNGQQESCGRTLPEELDAAKELVQKKPTNTIPIGLRYLALCASQCARAQRLTPCGGRR
jgi:hypothetical protein